ncbi:MAG: histidine-type phosphatase [Firmicutes bacterium]|nr:histidine-type phosphatase [Bacillota bacterium]
MKKNKILSIILLTTMCFTGCVQTPQSAQNNTIPQAQTNIETQVQTEDESHVSMETNRPDTENYTLKEVVVMSRHNIRSPLSSNGAAHVIATPHEWIKWTSNSSELSLRGGVLETMMGQYFRKWLEAEGLIPENYIPEEGEVRFYANSKQRTIATAQYFSSGFLPAANVRIEQKGEFNKMNPVFDPKIDFYSASYEEAVQKQFEERGGAEIAAELEENYKLLADVVDYTDSEGYKSGELKDLVIDDTTITLESDKEIAIGGTLATACSISDPLVLQYYEEPDPIKAAFGNELTNEQWEQIAAITTKFNQVRHGLPLVAVNAAHPLLQEIRSEFTNDSRKFTFLCGHDANIMGILTAMESEDYELPYTLEKKTPIGAKLVFEKWEDKDGNEFAVVELVYQSTEQLRSRSFVTLDTPPAIYSLSFKGMEKNADGLYSYDDLTERLDKAINAYDEMVNEYSNENAIDEAA